MRNLTFSLFLAAVLIYGSSAQDVAPFPNRVQLGSKLADTLLIHKEEPACQKDQDGVMVTGTVVIAITIDKNGKVTDLQLVGMSGSDRLDDAWLSVFRNRTVPAPTPDMDADNGYTFRATLQYVLVEMAPP